MSCVSCGDVTAVIRERMDSGVHLGAPHRCPRGPASVAGNGAAAGHEPRVVLQTVRPDGGAASSMLGRIRQTPGASEQHDDPQNQYR